MEFKLMNLIPESWIHALGATLFHSLWEGVILALLGAVIMLATRKTSARVRYNFLVASLFLFVLAIAVTFCIELRKQGASVLNQKLTGEEVNINLKAIHHDNLVNLPGHMAFWSAERLLNILNSYSLQIVLIWFLIICARSIQLFASLIGIDRLRKHQVYPAGLIWEEHLEVLSDKIGLKKQVTLLQSGIAKVPLALGHFKPLILIPLGLLNSLSSAEVEAILSHELAHIKRRDFLVNLLQSFIEILFFFNPAVLWLSQLIKTEREHCCDDLAIACISDRKNYVKALISCQEFEQRAPAYAMGITGKKGSLLNRASRTLLKTNLTLNKMEKTILTIALVCTVMFTVAFKSVSNAAVFNRNANAISTVLQQDTSKKIPAKENKSADILEKEIQQKITAANQKSVTAADERQAATDAKQAIKDAKQARIDAKQAGIDAKQAKIDARQAVIDSKLAEEDAEWIAQDQLQEPTPDKAPRVPKAPRPPKPVRGAVGVVPPMFPTPPTPPTPVTGPLLTTPPVPPTPPSSGKRTSKTSVEHVVTSKSVTNGDGRDYTTEINNQLLKDQIIKNTNNLSYKLNKDELIVNGVKQSAEVQKKYKSKYLKNDRHSLMYNYLIEKSSSGQ
ncbi:M56 family metallopeptidase [Pedobacter frigidisoli]|uniref:M56 family metallopeptidase n=1 Tax=Pedobacter frigidisoli TaxID=2530455 RepID=UPI002930D37B|nr:M56 family metallopeptidase [Pedobacter frigidisoli]